REHHRILVILNNVDLFAAELADDGLHAHAFHADAGAHRVHVLVLGHDCDLGALAGFAGNGADHHGVVVDFRHLGLEQVLHQLRRGARHDYLGTFGGFLHAHDDHAHALADGERLQPRLLLAPHARFGLANVEDHVGAFHTLHGGIHDFADAPDVLVVNRIALGLAHLLKDDLLGELRGDAPQHIGRFGNADLTAGLSGGIKT